jgi:hypothetical protein
MAIQFNMALQRITLSPEKSLVYVLRESGCHGHLTGGEVERIGISSIRIYDHHGRAFDYLSDGLRTWSVIDACGVPLPGWSAIAPEDVTRILAYSDIPK